jgi:hypothetical protein
VRLFTPAPSVVRTAVLIVACRNSNVACSLKRKSNAHAEKVMSHRQPSLDADRRDKSDAVRNRHGSNLIAPARRARRSIALKVGWTLCLAGAAIWLYGHNATGSPSLIDWYSDTPWWIAGILPNLESEMGTAALTIGAFLIYWPVRRKDAEEDSG